MPIHPSFQNFENFQPIFSENAANTSKYKFKVLFDEKEGLKFIIQQDDAYFAVPTKTKLEAFYKYSNQFSDKEFPEIIKNLAKHAFGIIRNNRKNTFDAACEKFNTIALQKEKARQEKAKRNIGISLDIEQIQNLSDEEKQAKIIQHTKDTIGKNHKAYSTLTFLPEHALDSPPPSSLSISEESYKLIQKNRAFVNLLKKKKNLLKTAKKQAKILNQKILEGYLEPSEIPEIIPCSYRGVHAQVETYGSSSKDSSGSFLRKGSFVGTCSRDQKQVIENELGEDEKEALHPHTSDLMGITHFKLNDRHIVTHSTFSTHEQQEQVFALVENVANSSSLTDDQQQKVLCTSASGKKRNRIRSLSLMSELLQSKTLDSDKNEGTKIRSEKEFIEKRGKEVLAKANLKGDLVYFNIALNKNVADSEIENTAPSFALGIKRVCQSLINNLKGYIGKKVSKTGFAKSNSKISSQAACIKYAKWAAEEIEALIVQHEAQNSSELGDENSLLFEELKHRLQIIQNKDLKSIFPCLTFEEDSLEHHILALYDLYIGIFSDCHLIANSDKSSSFLDQAGSIFRTSVQFLSSYSLDAENVKLHLALADIEFYLQPIIENARNKYLQYSEEVSGLDWSEIKKSISLEEDMYDYVYTQLSKAFSQEMAEIEDQREKTLIEIASIFNNNIDSIRASLDEKKEFKDLFAKYLNKVEHCQHPDEVLRAFDQFQHDEKAKKFSSIVAKLKKVDESFQNFLKKYEETVGASKLDLNKSVQAYFDLYIQEERSLRSDKKTPQESIDIFADLYQEYLSAAEIEDDSRCELFLGKIRGLCYNLNADQNKKVTELLSSRKSLDETKAKFEILMKEKSFSNNICRSEFLRSADGTAIFDQTRKYLSSSPTTLRAEQRLLSQVARDSSFVTSYSSTQQIFLLNLLDQKLGVTPFINCKSSCDRTAMALSQTLAFEDLSEIYKNSKEKIQDLEKAAHNYDANIKWIFDAYNAIFSDKNLSEEEKREKFEIYIRELEDTDPSVYLSYELQMAAFHHLCTTCQTRNILSTGFPGLKLKNTFGVNPNLYRLVPPYIYLKNKDGNKSPLTLQKQLGKLTPEAEEYIFAASALRGT